MKKILIIFGICGVMMACNNSERSSTADDSTTAGENQSAAAQQSSVDTNANKIGTGATASTGSAKGKEMITKSDCLTCHKVDGKIIGPSYTDVANKYTATDANIDLLASKIINGGSGTWGEIPMAPHPTIGTDDAKEMVKYILSLKTN